MRLLSASLKIDYTPDKELRLVHRPPIWLIIVFILTIAGICIGLQALFSDGVSMALLLILPAGWIGWLLWDMWRSTVIPVAGGTLSWHVGWRKYAIQQGEVLAAKVTERQVILAHSTGVPSTLIINVWAADGTRMRPGIDPSNAWRLIFIFDHRSRIRSNVESADQIEVLRVSLKELGYTADLPVG